MNETKTLRDAAVEYVREVKTTKVISDCPKVPTNAEIKLVEHNNKDGSSWTQYEVVVAGQTYRVPKTVLEKLQTILKFAPDLEYFTVKKTGTTKDDTKYSVEPVFDKNPEIVLG